MLLLTADRQRLYVYPHIYGSISSGTTDVKLKQQVFTFCKTTPINVYLFDQNFVSLVFKEKGRLIFHRVDLLQ